MLVLLRLLLLLLLLLSMLLIRLISTSCPLLLLLVVLIYLFLEVVQQKKLVPLVDPPQLRVEGLAVRIASQSIQSLHIINLLLCHQLRLGRGLIGMSSKPSNSIREVSFVRHHLETLFIGLRPALLSEFLDLIVSQLGADHRT
jgi:hypothetical protein